MYIVTLESKDKHKFEFICDAENNYEAIIKAKQKILEKGWTGYLYEIIDVKLKENKWLNEKKPF